MNEVKFNTELERLKNTTEYKKIDNISKFSKILSSVSIIVLFIIFTYGVFNLKKLNYETKELQQKKLDLISEITSLKTEKDSLEIKKINIEKELLSKYGLDIKNISNKNIKTVLQKSLLANDAFNDLTLNYTKRNNLEIRYYVKSIDDKRIVFELENLGYVFHKSTPNTKMKNQITNAIWYGSNVSIKDIKIVALALIRAGINIRGIRPFKNTVADSNFKNNIIEIGASVDLNEKAPLLVEDIINAKEFKR